MLQRGVVTVVPADDEWFYLEVDNDVDPKTVVVSSGYNPNRFEYLGPNFTGTRTYRVKLVRLGYVQNFKDAENKADKLGYRLVEGQAREPFKAKFPKPASIDPIIFGGSGWQGLDGYVYVAYLHGFDDAWHSHFIWSHDNLSDNNFNDEWRWLVVGK